jgi:hypothetical protein
MNPVETHEITELISKLRDDGGHTILVIEHDMRRRGTPTVWSRSTTARRSPRDVRAGRDLNPRVSGTGTSAAERK